MEIINLIVARTIITMAALSGSTGSEPSMEAPAVMEGKLEEITPKTSQDPVLEYRPSLKKKIARLPKATLESLPELVKSFKNWETWFSLGHQEAKFGSMRKRAPELGSPRYEYVPTDAELLYSVLGTRLQHVIDTFKADEVRKALNGFEGTLPYNRIDIPTAEGNAYAKAPRTAKIVLPGKESENFNGHGSRTIEKLVIKYRPKLELMLEFLPKENLESFPELVKTLYITRMEAEKKPGTWRKGSVEKGAPLDEYVPSDPELLVSVIGNRIRKVVENHSGEEVQKALGGFEGRLSFGEIEIYDAIVFGTGHFYYARSPKMVEITLPGKND